MENGKRLTREEFLAKMARYYDNDCQIFVAAAKNDGGVCALTLDIYGCSPDTLACAMLAVMDNHPETALAIIKRREQDKIPQNIGNTTGTIN